jgi:hypothetical protein
VAARLGGSRFQRLPRGGNELLTGAPEDGVAGLTQACEELPAMRMAALICSGCMVVRSNLTC